VPINDIPSCEKRRDCWKIIGLLVVFGIWETVQITGSDLQIVKGFVAKCRNPFTVHSVFYSVCHDNGVLQAYVGESSQCLYWTFIPCSQGAAELHSQRYELGRYSNSGIQTGGCSITTKEKWTSRTTVMKKTLVITVPLVKMN
jgi:hypothetical protein